MPVFEIVNSIGDTEIHPFFTEPWWWEEEINRKSRSISSAGKSTPVIWSPLKSALLVHKVPANRALVATCYWHQQKGWCWRMEFMGSRQVFCFFLGGRIISVNGFHWVPCPHFEMLFFYSEVADVFRTWLVMDWSKSIHCCLPSWGPVELWRSFHVATCFVRVILVLHLFNGKL